METFADVDCVLKVNQHCDTCKMKMMEVLSSIVGVYSVTIDAPQGLVKISGEVDPNMLLNAIAKTGKHAEIVFTKLKHPQVSRTRRGYGSNNSPNCNSGYRNNYGAVDRDPYYPFHCYRIQTSPDPQDAYQRPNYTEYCNKDFSRGRYVPSYPPRDNNPLAYNKPDFPSARYVPSYPLRDNNPLAYNKPDFPPGRYVPSYPSRDNNPLAYNKPDFFSARYVPSYPPRDNNPLTYNKPDFPPARYVPSYPPGHYTL